MSISFIFQICSIFKKKIVHKVNSTQVLFPVAYIKTVVLDHVYVIFRNFTISVGSTNTVYRGSSFFFAENILIKFNPYNVPYCNCMVILYFEFALQVHSSFSTYGFWGAITM